jgi:adenine-specific DNA methylase
MDVTRAKTWQDDERQGACVHPISEMARTDARYAIIRTGTATIHNLASGNGETRIMAEKKSKTDVTARDKSGKPTNHNCANCGERIMNDREMVVVMDGRRRNKTYHHRACFQKSIA